MRILVIEPNKRPYVKDIDGTDEALRKIIGDDLEISVPFINDMYVHLADNLGKACCDCCYLAETDQRH